MYSLVFDFFCLASCFRESHMLSGVLVTHSALLLSCVLSCRRTLSCFFTLLSGHLRCSQFPAVRTKAAVHIHVQGFLWTDGHTLPFLLSTPSSGSAKLSTGIIFCICLFFSMVHLSHQASRGWGLCSPLEAQVPASTWPVGGAQQVHTE